MGNIYDTNGKREYSHPPVSERDWFQEHHLFQVQVLISREAQVLYVKWYRTMHIHIK